MITKAQARERLKLPLTTLCLAVLSKEKGVLAEAKELVLQAVDKIIDDAQKR